MTLIPGVSQAETREQIEAKRELIAAAIREVRQMNNMPNYGEATMVRIAGAIQDKLAPLPAEPKTVTLPNTTRTFRCVKSEWSGKDLLQYRDGDGAWVDFYWVEDFRKIAALLPATDTARRYTVEEVCKNARAILERFESDSFDNDDDDAKVLSLQIAIGRVLKNLAPSSVSAVAPAVDIAPVVGGHFWTEAERNSQGFVLTGPGRRWMVCAGRTLEGIPIHPVDEPTVRALGKLAGMVDRNTFEESLFRIAIRFAAHAKGTSVAHIEATRNNTYLEGEIAHELATVFGEDANGR